MMPHSTRNQTVAEPPDRAERERALDVTRSFIVQAPAGSGKTELLTQRFVHLLAVVESPSEVVAITFTRKAAAEMRARINERLQQAQPGSAAYIARERHPAALSQPELLRVQTFDTFFRALTRFAPVALGVATDAMIDESPQQRYEKAAVAALAAREIAPQLKMVLGRLDAHYASAVQLIAMLLAKRDQWLPLSQSAAQDATTSSALVETIACAEIARVLESARARLQKAIPPAQIKEWLRLARFAGAHKPDHVEISDTWPATEPTSLPVWLQLLDLSVTKENGMRQVVNVSNGFPPAIKVEKEKWIAHQEQMGEYALDVCEIAQAIRALPTLDDLMSDGDTLAAIMSVLTLAAAHLHVDFAQTNTVDFVSVALAAQRGIVGDDAVLREPIARSTRHVLVDEFQDTSITQFNFLEGITHAWAALGTGDETLFCVGDPMQSIYRFRQAEVELFSKAQQHGLGAKALTSITLSANFRSDAPLVEWVNTHIEPAIASRNAMSRVSIAFAPGSPMLEGRADAEVVAHAFESALDEAQWVASQISETLKNTQDTIGVLVPNRSAGAPIIAAMRNANIAFDARETERLSDAHWVRDLLSLTFALSEPEDSLSWLAILRAPWCGLALPDLTRIAAATADVRSVWDASADFAALKLSEDGVARLAQWRAQLAPCVAALGARPLAEIVEAAWARLDARACTPASSREDFEAVIEAIRAHEMGGRLPERNALVVALDRLERTDIAASRVQVMTIHKAKGLQFDTVIVPAMAKGGKSDDDPLLRWMRFPAGAMIVPKPMGKSDPLASAYEWLKGLDESEQDAERARLLYVATTRAKRRLLLTATVKFDDANAPVRPAKSLFGTLPAFTRLIVHRAETDAKPEAEKEPFSGRYLLRRAQFAPQVLAVSHAVVTLPPRETAHARAARALGTIAHAWLCAHSNRSAWSESTEQWAHAQFRAANVAEPLRSAQVELLRALVEKTRTSAHAKFVFDPSHESWDEISFAAHKSDGEPTTLRPDRIVRTAEGAWWVIDYKTATLENVSAESVAAFLAAQRKSYQDIMQSYAQALRQWKQIPADQPIRCALYFPLLDEFATL